MNCQGCSEYFPLGYCGKYTDGFFSLGILNIFACLPQMVGSFISFVVFSILEPGKSPEFSDDVDVVQPAKGVNAIAVCLGIGAISTLAAAHYTIKFKNNYR
jgi:solute carrier family 45 protein 1/2/4